MSDIKAVLLNVDDTIFDNRYSTREGLRLVWMRYPVFQDIPVEVMEQEYLDIVEEMRFANVLHGKLSQAEILAEIFKLLFIKRQPEVDFHTANNAAAMFRSKYRRIRRAVKGSDELLAALHKKYKVGIVTNNPDRELKEKTEFTGFDKYITATATAQETGAAKPAPRIFRIALEKLGASADETVMIGNNWNWDILGAHEMGIKCIWLNTYGRQNPNPAIAPEIKSLEDTEHILKLIEM